MLHILWVIIRFIFILLGILLGLLLLAVILLLFCPVRYHSAASLEEEDWKNAELTAGVSWLFHGISLKVKKHGSETGFSIRLFGIPLDKLIFRKRKKKDKKEEISDENNHIDALPKFEESADLSSDEEDWKNREQPVSDQEEEYSDEKRDGLFSRIQGKLKEIPVKLRNIALTFRRIRGKIGWYQKLWQHPRTQEAFSLVMRHAGFLLKHILPTKLEGKIIFGFEDPSLTGSVLGVLGMTIPFHKNCVEVTPVFDGGNLLKGNIMLRGRVYGVVLVRAALMIYFNKNVKYVMKRWKHKEG